MAQSGYTPILIYASGTASNVPSATNLTSSSSGAELALNYTDGKLYYKDNSGTVQVLASKASASNTFQTSLSGLTPSTATTGAVTLAGTLGVASGGTGLNSLTSNYIPYGNGTAAFNSSSGFTFNGTTLSAPNYLSTATISNPTNVGAYSFGSLNYYDTGLFGTFATTINGYGYLAVQNQSSGGFASTDFAIYNNNNGTNYVNVGINSSGYGAFSGTGGTGGTSSTTLTISAVSSGNLLYGAVVSGTGISGSPTITTQLTATGTPVASPTATGTSGTSVITVSANTGIAIGQLISGTGIPSGTFVGSFGTSNPLQINLVNSSFASVNLTTTASGTYNFYLQGGVGTYTLSSAQTVSNGTTITAQVAGSFNQPNNGYLYSYSSDMVIGTYSTNSLRLNVNNSTTDSMVVSGSTGLVAFPGTGAITLPSGTTSQQPSAVAGMLRFNSQTSQFEGYNGSAWASVGGAAISNVTNNATYYPLFANATSGTALTIYTSSPNYTYNPSTGNLQAPQLYSSNGLTVNSLTVSTSYTIPTGASAFSVGPVSVATGQTVTVPSGSRWVVL